jgi:ParB family chromosome partitioning protein
MPGSRQSRYKDRYEKLLDDSLAIVQATHFSSEELAQTAEDAFKRVPGAALVPIDRIEPNPDNPRQDMDEAALVDLAASIGERGLLQPLVVRRDPDRPGHYVVIAGSRRLLAARMVHGDPDEVLRGRATQLPCLIKDISDRDAFADALLENLARADLSRAETMDALLRLHQDYGWSGKYIARRTGRSQGDVSELLGIAQDADLGTLVRQEKVRPSTATIIKRLPALARAATIAEVQAGKPVTLAEVQRRLRASRAARPPLPEAPGTLEAYVPEHAGVSISIPPAAAAATCASPLEAPAPARGVTPRRPGMHSSAPGASGLAAQLDGISALIGLVEMETPEGQAVLAAVRRDLAAAYEKLAAYVAQRDASTP